MFVTGVLIALNALIWGSWTYAFARHEASSQAQAVWYIYGPMAVLICTTLVPTIALLAGRLHAGRARTVLRTALLLSAIGFFPYACMSGGGV